MGKGYFLYQVVSVPVMDEAAGFGVEAISVQFSGGNANVVGAIKAVSIVLE